MILIQLVLQCIPSSEFKAEIGNPHNEAGALWQQIMRMVRCKLSKGSSRLKLTISSPVGIVDVLLERRDGAVKTAIELCALARSPMLTHRLTLA